MTAYDNSYSRMVTWLKVLLPLAALAILSTLFLVSRSIDPSLALPYAKAELQELAREPKIGNPSFSGVTENGSAIDLSADFGLPLQGSQSGLKTIGLHGVFETPDGQMLDISAPTGIFDSAARIATLRDGVSLATSSGYLIKTEGIIADLNTSTISTIGEISADGPLGQIFAGQMIFRQISPQGSDTGYELVFKNRVKLIYVPQQQ